VGNGWENEVPVNEKGYPLSGSSFSKKDLEG